MVGSIHLTFLYHHVCFCFCTGAYITTFGVAPTAPIVLKENTDDQVFTLNAYIESDIDQQSVSGINLWAMKAFFNPSPDCEGVDDMGNHIRISETDAEFLRGQDDDQDLAAGGRINFNPVRVELDFQDLTCRDLEPQTYLCLEVLRNDDAVPRFTLLGNTLRGVHAECKGMRKE